MGLIKAAMSSVRATMRDQWQDCIVPARMDNKTILSVGVKTLKPGQNPNKNKQPNTVTDGSIVNVGERQMMLLVDGGKIIDYSAEPGYFEVKNANAPSLFKGDFEGAISDAFNRFKFGGATPYNQQVFYINLSEIQNIPFGTKSPINYYDEFYKIELFLRIHGFYSIKIVDPIKFYMEAISKNAAFVDINDFKELYMFEFLSGLQTAVGKLSVEGVRYSHLPSKNLEIAEHMESALDSKWKDNRGMEIESVALSGLALTQESQKILDIRNQGVVLSDAEIRAGYVQGTIARGLESAGSNPAGATTAFVGMNTGMGSASEIFASSNASTAGVKEAKSEHWLCLKCNFEASGQFCSNCGEPVPKGKFCSGCGNQVASSDKFCKECGRTL